MHAAAAAVTVLRSAFQFRCEFVLFSSSILSEQIEEKNGEKEQAECRKQAFNEHRYALRMR